MERNQLIVIIPAYNEKKTIGEIVTAVKNYSDVLVVDDCSTDQTGRTAEMAGAIVIRNPRNMGYAKTLDLGLKWAFDNKKKAVILMDADGEHSPENLPAFIHHIKAPNTDIILGVRPHYARFSEMLFGLIFWLRFRVSDPLCGMKALKIDVWQQFGPIEEIETVGTQMFYKALKKNKPHIELKVFGKKRKDNPRFGSKVFANLYISRALLNLMLFKRY